MFFSLHNYLNACLCICPQLCQFNIISKMLVRFRYLSTSFLLHIFGINNIQLRTLFHLTFSIGFTQSKLYKTADPHSLAAHGVIFCRPQSQG